MGQIDRCNHDPFKTCANLADNRWEFPIFQAVTIGMDIARYSVKSESVWTVIRRKKRTSAGEVSNRAKIKECIGDCIFYPIYMRVVPK